MKKIIMAVTFCIGFAPYILFAGDDSIKAHINNTLLLLFEITDKNNSVNAGDYQQKTFVYNGMPVTVFKSKKSNWIGYFKKLTAGDLPENAVSELKGKYNNGKIDKVIMHFNNAGEISYFAEVILKQKCIILKIQESGHSKVFN